ncbi:MAG: tetratricopeptide repeat protein [Oligoflexia bacterium]|nr:tetratricopeptide repeat protein [Oligoflexia bacterium]
MEKFNFETFVADNWKFLAGLVAGVAIVCGGAFGWIEYKQARERKAHELLFSISQEVQPKVESKDFDSVKNSYQDLFEKYPNTRASYEAALQLGDYQMDAGNPKEAVPFYQQAMKAAGDGFSSVLARYSLGIAEEQSGNCEGAVLSYDEAIKAKEGDFLKPELMMAKARCFEALKQIDKAIETYKQVQSQFANRSFYSGAASAFEKRLQN